MIEEALAVTFSLEVVLKWYLSLFVRKANATTPHDLPKGNGHKDSPKYRSSF
jgi:hypothetical protein